jgi:hypothetical protein
MTSASAKTPFRSSHAARAGGPPRGRFILWWLAALLAPGGACVDLTEPWNEARPAGAAGDASGWNTGGTVETSADAPARDDVWPGEQGGIDGGAGGAGGWDADTEMASGATGGTTGSGGGDAGIGPGEAGLGGDSGGGVSVDGPGEEVTGDTGEARAREDASADVQEVAGDLHDFDLANPRPDVPVVAEPDASGDGAPDAPDDRATDDGAADGSADSLPDAGVDDVSATGVVDAADAGVVDNAYDAAGGDLDAPVDTVDGAADAPPDEISVVGLVAYYPCEGPGGASGNLLLDVSGNDRHGTLATGPAPTAGAGGAGGTGGAGGAGGAFSFGAGRLGNALTLSGSAHGYVELPAGLLAGQHEMTVAAWIRARSTAAFQRVFDFGTSTSNFMYLATANSSNSGPRFRIATSASGSDAGVSQVLEGTEPIVTGSWTHIALVLGPSGASIYVNGHLQKSDAALTLRPADLGSTTSNFIGRSAFPADPYFDGDIDEYRIYARALSDQEIAWLAGQQS